MLIIGNLATAYTYLIQNLSIFVAIKSFKICMKDSNRDLKIEKSSMQDADNEKANMLLNFWLLENMKIMEELTIKEPVSWSEVDWGG